MTEGRAPHLLERHLVSHTPPMTSRVCAPIVLAFLAGCATSSEDTTAPTKDASVDTTADTSVVDAAKDAPADTSSEGAVDTAVDTPSDVACDKVLCSGKCVDTLSDVDNCGTCGTKCGSTAGCVDGKCVSCDAPTKRCGAKCVDTSSDSANCGACGVACTDGKVCLGGTCACASGTLLCGGKCIDPFNDKANCGACAKACATDEICTAAACDKVCTKPLEKCGGGCIDLTKDAANCGACAKACPKGETCSSSACACGATGASCAAGRECVSGACKCVTGTDCSGACVDTTSDASNCGVCGKVCPSPGACVAGSCSSVLKCNGAAPKVLVYSPLGTGTTTYLPAGATTTTVDATGWSALTTADFKSYQLIVFGDQGYSPGATAWDAIYATRAKWFPAITGRVLVHTFDPVAHTGTVGATTFTTATLKWAAGGPGTGLWVGPDYGDRKLDVLSDFGTWGVLGQKTDGLSGDDVTVDLPSHGSMVGSSSSSLSSWSYSYHAAVTAWPTAFVKVASITSSSSRALVVAKDVTCAP